MTQVKERSKVASVALFMCAGLIKESDIPWWTFRDVLVPGKDHGADELVPMWGDYDFRGGFLIIQTMVDFLNDVELQEALETALFDGASMGYDDEYKCLLKIIQAADVIEKHASAYSLEDEIQGIKIALNTIAKCQLMVIENSSRGR